jgi:hypothetical protein
MGHYRTIPTKNHCLLFNFLQSSSKELTNRFV